MSVENAPVVDVDEAAIPVEKKMYYRFESNDKKEFRVSELAIQQSETLNRLVEAMGYTSEDVENKPAIAIENIDGKTLKLVFQWCEHHKGEAIPVDDGSVPKIVEIPEFDAKLMDIDNGLLFKLIWAADYLNIVQLLNVSCKKVANMAQGKTPAQLRRVYLLPSDEEDEAAKRAAQEAQDPRAREVEEEFEERKRQGGNSFF
ncbi:hypothetical protein CAEBREN_03080 [Caenorhabditis brenneri]|uniref:Skp1-related protein n=1 Tax=Caenorhabditis brenneri TaxID=135651 RepID=G0NL14_CAEBE|nr:hypothetical protein CAEBREN_03080 [Caenorhabditis brenneri]